MTALLSGEGLHVAFGATQALSGMSIEVAAGEVVAVMGPSGCGKSTLLHVLAGILLPDEGAVTFDGNRLDQWADTKRADTRLRRFGFVFQFGDLVPELTLGENVALPLELAGMRTRDARVKAASVMETLDIAGQADLRTSEASGGQVQRAAVARAVVHEPAVVFADEPTGALDSVTGELVLDAIVRLSRENGTAVLLVTHDSRVAAHAQREVRMSDGTLAVPTPLRASP